jgi:hypothetical protein
MLVKVGVVAVETCHCTVGVGDPDAAALNEAVVPDGTLWLVGLSVIAGALGVADPTVNVAGDVVALPKKLEKTASNSLPFCAEVAVKL